MDHSICRLCNENVGVSSLFDIGNCDIQLSEKVNYCIKVTVVKGDGLPTNICTCCEQELTSMYNFALKCEDSDKKFRSLQLTLKQEYEIKQDIETENFEDFPAESVSDLPYDSPSPIKEEKVPELRTKRKYVRRNVKKKSRSLGPNTCEVCGRKCNNPSTLTIHMRSHTNEKPHGCPSCDKKYKDSGTLKRHIERNHDNDRTRSFICEQCGKSFYSKSDCKIHMRIHTGETPYACTKCPARFTQVGTLQRHILTHTGERSHMCSKCSKKFPTREQLKKHYLVHSDEKRYKCFLCNIPFKYDNSLRKHLRMHTEGMHKKFICNYCKRGFPSKGNLKSHIKKQHSSKSGYCNDCSKHVPNLEMHTWKHAGVRSIKCELCSSSFFDRKGLSTHVSFRHKSVDKYKCTVDECIQKFPSLPMLEYHVMRYHKLIKPFSCDKCPRCFYRKSDLVRHRKGTHKEHMQ